MNMPTARAEMLVRCAPADAFDAFVDPQRIRQFWLRDTSGPLAPHARVEWDFMVPGARDTVAVTGFEANRRIAFDWSDGQLVDMRFHAHGVDATRIAITVSGFVGDDAAAQAIDATEGFAIVLCDLKSLLETGASGGMVRDKALLIAERLAAKR
jgi:uncharacterized protein YndB with AHSA1/START domain